MVSTRNQAKDAPENSSPSDNSNEEKSPSDENEKENENKENEDVDDLQNTLHILEHYCTGGDINGIHNLFFLLDNIGIV